MTARQLYVKLVLTTGFALCTPHLLANGGLAGALSRSNLARPLGRSLAIADFDRDSKADGAVLIDPDRRLGEHSFRIEFHLSGRANAKVSFESRAAGHRIGAWDIDRDGDTDVIVGEAFTQQLLHVWLNDGHGAFHKGRIEDYPSATSPSHERWTRPDHWQYAPSFSLPVQRGSEFAILTALRLPSGLSSGRELVSLAVDLSPPSAVASHSRPRAPPPVSL